MIVQIIKIFSFLFFVTTVNADIMKCCQTLNVKQSVSSHIKESFEGERCPRPISSPITDQNISNIIAPVANLSCKQKPQDEKKALSDGKANLEARYKAVLLKLIESNHNLLSQQYKALSKGKMTQKEKDYKKFFLMNQFRSVLLVRAFDQNANSRLLSDQFKREETRAIQNETKFSLDLSRSIKNSSDGGTLATLAAGDVQSKSKKRIAAIKQETNLRIEEYNALMEQKKFELIGQNSLMYHDKMTSFFNHELFKFMIEGKEKRAFVNEYLDVNDKILGLLRKNKLGPKELDEIFVGTPGKETNFQKMFNAYIEKSLDDPKIEYAIDQAFISRINELEKAMNFIKTNPLEKLGLEQIPNLADKIIADMPSPQQQNAIYAYCLMQASIKTDRNISMIAGGVFFVGGVAVNFLPIPVISQMLSGTLFAGSAALSGMDLYRVINLNQAHHQNRALYYSGAITPTEFNQLSDKLQSENKMAVFNSFLLLTSVLPTKVRLGADDLKPSVTTVFKAALKPKRNYYTEEELFKMSQNAGITVDEFKALRSYSVNGYMEMNECLRAKACDEIQKALIQKVKTALEKMKAKEVESAPVLYRGVKDPFVIYKLEESLKSSKPVFSDAGFLSTSVDETVARNFASLPIPDAKLAVKVEQAATSAIVNPKSQALMIIKPKTNRCVNISKLAHFAFEQEVLCLPGVKFNIRKEISENNYTYVLEEIAE